MEEIKILFIEDEDIFQEAFNDAKEVFISRNPSYTINLVTETNININVFKEILKGVDFIITDLRLPDIGEGNDIIDIIKSSNVVPLFIVTAREGDLTSIDETDFYKIYDKADGDGNIYENVLTDIKNIYETGITKIIGNHGKINKILKKLIWDGGLDNIEEWKLFGDIEKSEKSLSRYILSHIHHELSGDYKDFHSEEIYLKPINEVFGTGSILEKEEKFYIILTPACDIQHGELDYYLASEIIALGSSCNLTTAYNNYTSISNQEEKAKKLRTFENVFKSYNKDNSKSQKYLPKTNIFIGGFINFKKLHKIKITDSSEYNLICNVSSHFLRDIISDFGYYYSRQGQPDLNSQIVAKKLI